MHWRLGAELATGITPGHRWIGLALSVTVVLPGMALALGSATPALAASGEDRRLAVWNHDIENGSDGRTPADWSAAGRAVRVDAPKPFPRYDGDGDRNHALWLYDSSKRSGASARSRSLTAVAGRTYTVSAQVYRARGTAATVNLEFLNSAGRRLRLVGQASRGPGTGRLGTVKASGVAPSRTAAVRVLLASSTRATGSSYTDQIFLAERVPTASYPTGLSTGAVLFVGDHRVERASGLTRVVQPGRKHGGAAATPVYDAVSAGGGQPAHSAQLFGTVLHEDGVYKMWLTAKAAGSPWSVRYTESVDGRSFPPGQQVLSDVWAAGVVRNPRTTDPAKKYLMLGVRGTLPGDVSYRAYASPDGRRWTALSSRPVLPMRDVASVSFDARTAKFVATTKQASGTNRQAYVSYSTDFVHWTTPKQALRTDSRDSSASSVYGAPVFRYGDQLLALPLIYTQGVVNGVNGPITPQLASSTDGVRWDRPARSPVVRLGAQGDLDDGFIMTASQPIVVGDKVRLYYGGWSAGHETPTRSSRIFYAEWTRDRFVAMRAGAAGGTLTTRPLLPSGRSLSVNAAIAAGGRLRVSVLDARTGTVIPGYEDTRSTVVTGDALDASVTWSGKDLSGLKGRQLKLRFTFASGDLYSFRVS